MNQKLFTIREASKHSGLGAETIRKFIELKAVTPAKNNKKELLINSFGLTRLKKISEFVDNGLSNTEIIKELDIK